MTRRIRFTVEAAIGYARREWGAKGLATAIGGKVMKTALQEAMAAGVPVIASNTPAVAEAVADGALLLPPRDAEVWAEAIERVLIDEAEARRLSAAGLRRAALFSWKRCTEETIDIYYRVAKAPRP